MSQEIKEKTSNTLVIKRPPSLTLVCILTFIGSGMAAFSSLIIFLAYKEIPLLVDEALLPQATEMMSVILAAGKWFFLINLIFYTISLSGAIIMWKLNKNGFHLYATAQLLLLLAPLLMIEGYSLPFSSILLTVAFIASYALNLRFLTNMKKI